MVNSRLDWMWSYWDSLYLWLLRGMMKYLIHFITGQCELLRIVCSSSHSGIKRLKKIEKCLRLSRKLEVKHLASAHSFDIKRTVDDICKLKHIGASNLIQFSEVFGGCLERISAYNNLLEVIETHRRTMYDCHSDHHEAMLLQLWDHTRPECPLTSRISEQWTEIGFQGNDPATDFRGMGLLGLEQLAYFARENTERCQHIICQSQHPTKGYSFAIVGINLTAMLHQLMKTRKLRSHFYNLPLSRTSLTEYHQLYCYVVYEFDKYWTKKDPSSIMEFNRIREKFQHKLVARLKISHLPLDMTESFS